MVKNLPVMQETQVLSLGQEDPLEKKMATHSSILAWRIPWTEEPDGLQSMGSQRVGPDWATNTHTHTHTAALQCCVSFRCTMKWISNMHTYMPSLPTTHHPIHLGHHRALTWAPSTIYQIPIAICVTHGCGHTAIPTHPIPLPHPMSTHPFLMSASLFLPCK